jgi:hypothetical protein
MLELTGFDSSSPAMSAFVIGSAICIVLNVLLAAWLFLKADLPAPEDRAHASRLKVVAATAGATLFLLTGVAAGIGLIASQRQAVAVNAPATTISVEAIQRGIDTKTLPVSAVSDHM